MRLFRVHPWIEDSSPREPYGPLFIPPGQGYGRWDNPDLYQLRYFGTTPEGAIAETFGSLARWSDAMLRVPTSPEATRALSTYTLPDDMHLADLDDPEVLLELGVGAVTDVVGRQRRRTQRLAARIFESGDWGGIRWWSYYRPEISLVATWADDTLRCVGTSPLKVRDDAVVQAARLIVRSVV